MAVVCQTGPGGDATVVMQRDQQLVLRGELVSDLLLGSGTTLFPQWVRDDTDRGVGSYDTEQPVTSDPAAAL